MTKPRILIVEDEPLVAREIRQRLEGLGYEPLADTALAEEAISLTEQLRPDLVLMELHLQGKMDGIGAAQVIHDRFDLPVVFLTAFAGDETLHRAKKSEAFGYIFKPFDAQQLRMVIEMALYKHQAETLLRQGREEQAAILRGTSDGFWLVDMQGRILDVNEASCRMHGYSREEMLGRPLTDFEADETADEIAAGIEQIKRAGSAMLVRRHRCKDGHLIDLEVSIAYLPGDTGRFSAFLRDITDRKRAEEAQRENEDRYRDLVDNSRELISTYDLDGNFLSVNETTIRITGYPRATLLKMNLADLVVPEFRHLVPEFLKTLPAVGQANGIIRIQTANGEKRTWEHQTTLRSEGLAVPIVRGMALDITERLRSERALRASEAQLRVILESTDDGILAVDRQGRVLKTNQRFADLWQIPPSLIAGGDDQALLDHVVAQLAEPDAFLKRVQSLYASDASDLDLIYFKDGRCFERFSAPMLEGSAVTGRVWSFRDITERKRAEASLRLQSGALEAAANAIVITDRQGVIAWANRAFTEFTGYSVTEVVGKRPGDLLKSGNHDPAFYKAMWNTILAGNVWQGELINRRKNGSLYTEEMTITPLKDQGGEVTHFVAVKQDVTQRKLLEERFLQSQKLEAVGRLAGGVAHDFNNMLGVILGYTDIALGQVDPSLRLHKDLHEIQKAAERSAGLTRQLLAFARKETITPKVLNLNETVAGMLTMLTRLIGEDIQVTFQPATTPWPVLMDPSQLDQILANLCVNSRDAIAGVGSIAIATANCAIDAAYCAANTDAAPGDYVRLNVSDTGGGMDQETLGQIFEPFFTTKKVGEGTGLGLPMVYGAVKQNLGFLTVASEPGQGTVVEIYLPRHLAQTEPARTADAGAPVVRGHETILLVEDEPALLKLIARVLEAQGYSVMAASTPGEAIGRARERGGEIQLLLTDVVMPEMNGRDLAKTLLALYPRLKRLFMSGYTADVIGQGGLLEEGVHFLQKPFAHADLVAKVRDVLDRE